MAWTALSLSLGVPAGTAAPPFTLPGTGGGQVTLSQVLAGGLPVLLLFFHPGCRPCADLAGDVPRWQAELAGTVRFALIGSGTVAENRDWASRHELGDMAVQDWNEVAVLYRLTATPAAVLIDARGRTAGPAAGGTYAIRDLIADRRTGKQALLGRRPISGRRERLACRCGRRHGWRPSWQVV
jgi:peroxiredoxin